MNIFHHWLVNGIIKGCACQHLSSSTLYFLTLPMLLLADALIATACESAPPSNASQDNADAGAHADANSDDRASAVQTGSL